MTKNKLTCSIKARCYGIEKCILRGQKALSRRHRMNVVSWSWFWFIDRAWKNQTTEIEFFADNFALFYYIFRQISNTKRGSTLKSILHFLLTRLCFILTVMLPIYICWTGALNNFSPCHMNRVWLKGSKANTRWCQ